ncbi:beta family protein [Pedobacter agri]|uniref:Beta protein n=1 Tax=Pedobacter agri TaxID=454586 RepID=A0A9X3I7X8_9SPHI|nr:beta family protein [Pedobacter agri]MCX3264222.1 hypothetical protein [Pedobacter agri]
MKYYPVLLSKAGELIALEKLAQNVKNSSAPIIQVVEDNFISVSDHLKNNWSFTNNEVLVDFSLIDSLPGKMADVTLLITDSVANGINIIPVIDSSSPIAYINAISSLVNQFNLKVCLREIYPSNLISLNSQIASILNTFSISESQIILLLDLGYVQASNFSMKVNNIAALIGGLTNVSNFDAIVVASGSFPENLSPFTANHLHIIRRYENDIWEYLTTQNLPQNLRYGDYGTKYPTYTNVSFTGTCSIKYTTPKTFAIYRGELSQNHPLGNAQYIQFAKQLVLASHYSGPSFSWGDQKIEIISLQSLSPPPRLKPGNAKTWVEISQNHHITLLESIL